MRPQWCELDHIEHFPEKWPPVFRRKCDHERVLITRLLIATSAGKLALASLFSADRVRRKPRTPPVRVKGRAMTHENSALDDKTRTELEAAAFRRLLEHLRARADVHNIDLMNLAGFCRNCLSNWMKDAADAKGVPMSKDESREAIYGMPYEEWKAKHQGAASTEQRAAFEKAAGK